MWDATRIEAEHKLRDNYGLKNLHELWRVTSEIRRIRRIVRNVLSGRVADDVGRNLIGRLSRYGVIKEDAVLDDILGITPEMILERRLQSLVYRRGFSRTIKQSRQLITHGFISINGRRVHSPGYLVRKSDESVIGYYRPIKIEIEQQGEGASAKPPGSSEAGTADAAPALK